MNPPITVRLRTKGDLERIFSDWLRSYRKEGGMGISNEVYFYWHHRVVESYWVDRSATWLVCCDTSDTSKIYGWLCGHVADSAAGDQRLLHYVYVPKLYRRLGVASRLVATFDQRQDRKDQAIVTTAQTAPGKLLVASLYAVNVYNPYFAWGRAPVLVPGRVPAAVLKAKDPIAASRKALLVPVKVLSEGEADHSGIESSADKSHQPTFVVGPSRRLF